MRHLDRVVAWVIILLGVRFALVAPHLFASTEWPWSTGCLQVVAGIVRLVLLASAALSVRPSSALVAGV
jgi:hypothetical protein